MNDTAPMKFGMGARPRRKEDKTLVTGTGRFTDDYTPPGCLRAYVVRSSMAHARIKVGDLAAAREMPGVQMIMTAADIEGVNGLPCKIKLLQIDGTYQKNPKHPLLCGEMVRHVGDPIAFIVADSLDEAVAAADAIEIDYDPLPAVVDMHRALEDDAPLVWPEYKSNVAFTCAKGSKAETDAAFLGAARVSRVEIVNNRLVANYMEPRGCVAEYDAGTDRYTLTMGTQGGHGMRDRIAKDVLGIPKEKMRIITPDVGGGFGTKSFCYQEYPLAALAAKALGRPVKWISDRNEHFLIDSHGRDNFAVAEMAMDENGRFLAMRVDLLANMGAYLSQYAPSIPEGGLTMTTGLYEIPSMYALCRGIYTHTVTVDAYRGAGRPEAAYLVERLVDQCGRDTGLGPVEIRRRNFIPTEMLPYETQGGRIYDSGEFGAHLTRALEVADWKGFDARYDEAKARGKIRGFGIATYVEACAFPGKEEATIRLNDDGTVTVFIGTQTNGQGHATAYAQFVGGHMGLDYDKINVVQGDTDQVPNGDGTGGSRSIPLGAVSVDRAAVKLSDQVKQLAAEQLEASVADLELADGSVRVVGTNRAVSLVDVARNAKDKSLLTGFDDSFEQPEPTYPNGTHIAEVEIDPETGVLTFANYVIVDDFGATVNPQLLEGQVHGGVVQGIGQAIYEHTVYDPDGQLLTASFLDYTMPRADGVPFFTFETRNVPSTTNAFGIKGAGEAGSIGSCPAVMNGIIDALNRGFGITAIDMPATPEKIWNAIQDAKA